MNKYSSLLSLAAVLSFGAATTANATDNNRMNFNTLYNGTIADCATCHIDGDTASNQFNAGYPTSLNTFFDGPGVDLDPLNSTDDSLRGLHAVEPTYAPSVASGDRHQTAASNATSVTIPILPGLNFNGTDSALAGVTGVWTVSDQGAVTKVAAEDSALITFTNSAQAWLDRGNRRRATPGVCSAGSPDYSLALSPRNTDSFDPNAPATIQSNTLTFCFTNVAPTAGSTTKTINVFENTSNVTLPGGGFITNILNQGQADSDVDSSTTTAGSELRAVLVSGPAHAQNFVLNDDGSFTYTASDADVSTTDSFQYRAKDNEDAESATITVSINIISAVDGNEAPNAVNDAITVAEDSGATDVDVMANDTDDGGVIHLTGIASVTGPGSATISPEGTKISVTPNPNAEAPFTVVYQVSDNYGVPATADLVVSIAPNQDWPTATTIVVAPDRDDTEPSFVVDLLDTAYVNDTDLADVLIVEETVLTALILNIGQLPIPPGFNLDFPVSGGQIVIDPVAFDFVDQGEQIDLRFTYTVNDGTGRTVDNAAYVTIIGTSNGPIRIPGQLADSLSSRYNGHFPQSNQDPEACLSCHVVGRAGAKVDRDCTATINGVPGVTIFNSYGMALCMARDPDDPPLSNLVARLEAQEDLYAPALSPITDIVIDEDADIGTLLAQLTADYNGSTINGAATSIVKYLINDDGIYRTTAYDGAFAIAADGALTVDGPLIPEVYEMDIRPVNDAGQITNQGTIIPGLPGFFPVRSDLVQSKIFNITVNAVPVVLADDTATVEAGGSVVIDVTANDTGGQISLIVLDGGQPGNGGVTLDLLNNQFTYTPNVGFTGVDTFRYIGYNYDNQASAPATVTVRVLETGGLVAVADTAGAVPAIENTIDVLANDLNAIRTETDAANATVVTLVAGTLPDTGTVGTLSVVGQNIVFVAAPGFTSGSTTFQYQGENPAISGLNSSIATVTISMVEFDETSGLGASAIPALAEMAQAFLQSCEYAIGSGTPGAEFSSFMNACANIQTAISNGENIDQAMRALRNEEHFAAIDMTALIARGLGNIVRGRMDQLQRGPTRGIDLSGISLSIEGAQIPTRSIQSVAEFLLGVRPEDQAPAFAGSSPWGLFMAGDFAFGKKAGSDTAGAFELSANNIVLGIDYRATPNLVYGLAAGYATSETNFADGGSMTGQGFQLSAFMSRENFMGPGLTLDGMIAIGHVAFNSDRAIVFTNNGISVDEIANARFNSLYVNIVPRLSYSYVFGEYGAPIGQLETDLRLTWFLSADYLMTHINGYTETGGGGLNLAVQGQTYHSLIASAGFKFDRPFYLSPQSKFTLFGGVTFNGAFLDNIRSVTSTFVEAGPGAPPFTITEPGTSGYYLSAELGASFDIGRGNLTLSYATEMQASNGITLERFSLAFATPIGESGFLGIGANRTTNPTRSAYGVELNYTQAF